MNPAAEDAYWRTAYATRPGYVAGYDYDADYAGAYRMGYEGRGRYAGRRWDDIEGSLRADWERAKDRSRLTWDQARYAVRDAWDRVDGHDAAGAPKMTDTAAGMVDNHPVGTTVGGLGGAAAGAAMGAVAGPVGMAAGAVAGALAGAAAGHGVARAVNPTAEDAYWRDSYTLAPGYRDGYTYDDYGPAYRLGYDGYGRYTGRTYDEVEPTLAREWDAIKGKSRLTWEEAKASTRAAWHRIERALPGDFDGDGR
ncbi:hypothetical protein [Ottowia sp. SB7-C50]|uniref:hypothetical protein n=1 Tax=Ottowia sp. SB7-C50 TaxID=3081231 RepID=UPI0029546C8E|nr:hypothetical protein [Ottowia sp. SB7-C50]WOP16736.1 hypothetical protein R0D99_06995 [Ottowia sp. SB7-C50]